MVSTLVFMLVALAVAGGVLYWTKARTEEARAGGDGRHRPSLDGADEPEAAPGATELDGPLDGTSDGAGGETRR